MAEPVNCKMSTAIAYWLTPTEPTRGFLEKLIVDLARRFGGPVFEPHVTIHVGPDQAEVAEQIVSHVAQGARPVSELTTEFDTYPGVEQFSVVERIATDAIPSLNAPLSR